MNSVALPAAGGGSQILGAEADLVRSAARGDADSFGELFRRHSAPAWRLAQALSADREGAIDIFCEGFVRSLRWSRSERRPAGAFRLHVLSMVYKAAADHSYESERPPAPARPRGGPEAALANAAFRSLPERWRAAVWLSQVENFDAERTAAVLNVSPGVADQLVGRGLKGLAGRYQQARREMPAHIGEVLRPLALAVPADLDEVATVRWSMLGADHLTSLVPVAKWLDDHAARPMAVAAGALIGLGLIGLGVVPGTGGSPAQLGANGTTSVYGSQSISACVGPNCASPASTARAAAGLEGIFAPTGPSSTGLPSTGLSSTGLSSTAGGLAGTASGVPTAPASGPGASNVTATTPPAQTPPSSGPTPPSSPAPQPQPSGVTVFGVPGVLSVSAYHGSVTTNLLNGTATATAGSCGATASTAGYSAGGGCAQSPAPVSSPTAPTSALEPVTGVVKTLGSTTSGAVSTVTGSGTSSSGQGTSIISGL